MTQKITHYCDTDTKEECLYLDWYHELETDLCGIFEMWLDWADPETRHETPFEHVTIITLSSLLKNARNRDW